ncbi:MAG: proton-coupled thiamine transporter YuaJ [Lachnospiraceae bacterium]|nr:proton-coupled thiamine transporter YuaJ [Lachnospiraceae bacterium]
MSKFILTEDGYFALTQAGYVALAILILIAMLLTAFVADKKQNTKKINARQLAFSGIALALAFITSYIKYEMPMGGSVTLFSMFFICYIGYLFGIKVGILTAFSYSILQFIQSGGSYFLTPFQTCCDYFFAFTALGIAGLWYQKKHGLTIGYIVACLLRGLFHTIGGYMYWMDYMPESFPASLTAVYPIVYNYSYILIEMAITLVIINLPPVKKALDKTKQFHAN